MICGGIRSILMGVQTERCRSMSLCLIISPRELVVDDGVGELAIKFGRLEWWTLYSLQLVEFTR